MKKLFSHCSGLTRFASLHTAAQQEPINVQVIVQALNRKSEEAYYPHLAGIAQKDSYLLLLEPDALESVPEGLSLLVDGQTFEVLNMKAVMIAQTRSHWEGIMRLKGGL